MYKVLIPRDVNECGKAWLKERGYEIVMGSGYDEETLVREVADCDAILARTAPYTRRVIEASKKLKVIARFGVGYETVDVPAATENGVYVTIAKNTNMQAVAEHTMAMMLALAKKLVPKYNACKSGDWNIRNRMLSTELGGKTLGIIGIGNIGKVLAERAHYGLNMDIIAYDPYADEAKLADYVRLVDLDTLFATADVVSLHMPVTPETLYMVNTERLAQMKPTAMLVNVCRGRLVNEEALYEALKNGTIAAAATDVYEKEPNDPNLKLFELDNFIASPHCGGLTDEASDAMCMSCAQAIDDVLSGRAPLYPVNEPVFK